MRKVIKELSNNRMHKLLIQTVLLMRTFYLPTNVQDVVLSLYFGVTF